MQFVSLLYFEIILERRIKTFWIYMTMKQIIDHVVDTIEDRQEGLSDNLFPNYIVDYIGTLESDQAQICYIYEYLGYGGTPPASLSELLTLLKEDFLPFLGF
jgi:hypothetical protein|nr:MAG TPA: hypothetical protein [Caudoviricetes sp.]